MKSLREVTEGTALYGVDFDDPHSRTQEEHQMCSINANSKLKKFVCLIHL